MIGNVLKDKGLNDDVSMSQVRRQYTREIRSPIARENLFPVLLFMPLFMKNASNRWYSKILI